MSFMDRVRLFCAIVDCLLSGFLVFSWTRKVMTITPRPHMPRGGKSREAIAAIWRRRHGSARTFDVVNWRLRGLSERIRCCMKVPKPGGYYESQVQGERLGKLKHAIRTRTSAVGARKPSCTTV